MRVEVYRKQEPLQRLPDGALQAREGDTLRVVVTGEDPAVVSMGGQVLLVSGVKKTLEGLQVTAEVSILTWAGRSALHIDCGEERRMVSLDVAPHPGKLGREAFRELLEELSSGMRQLPWGLAPGEVAASRATGGPAITHPAVLEVELPILLDGLKRLAAEPLRWTERYREQRPLRQVRRLDTRSFTWLTRHPQSLAAVRGVHANPRAAVDISLVRTTLNHPATRYLLGRLRQLLQHLRRVQGCFARVAGGAGEGYRDPIAQARAKQLGSVVEDASQHLQAVLRRAPFRGLTPSLEVNTCAQILCDHPLYARVHRSICALLDPGLMLDIEGAVRAGLRPTWALYELAILRRLGLWLVGRTSESGWQPLQQGVLLAGVYTGLAWQGTRDGLRVELRYQQTFRSYGNGRTFTSLSSERCPDYVLGVFRGDRLLDWVILDAKYRSSRPAIHDGLAAIHVYRDALRWEGLPASAAWILVPRLRADTAVYGERSYHHTHHFGAIETESGGWDGLDGWVSRYLPTS
jgi:hypothetical protein